MTVGEKYGITHVGYYASRSLRVEKFFAFWGQDLDTMTTPLECGRTWRVKFDVSKIFTNHIWIIFLEPMETKANIYKC